MTCNVETQTFPVTTPVEEIAAGIENYACEATWQEGGGGLRSPIKFHEKLVFDLSKDAQDYMDKNWGDDRYDNHAVQYRQLTIEATQRVRESVAQIRNNYRAALEELSDLRTQQGALATYTTRDYATCENCGSRVKISFVRGTDCPVCKHSLLNKTGRKSVEALNTKVAKLRESLKAEERRQTLKELKAGNSELFWLVRYAYHT